ncbi:MAG: TspO/MBR family protein [bacterium]
MNNTYTWYQALIKPLWAPPSWLFGPVWTVLYAVIIISFGFVLYKAFNGKLPWIIALPFILNLLFNIAFTPLQFGLRNNLLAAIDIIFVLTTLIWSFIAIWPQMRWVVYVNIPYLLWVSFATVLQITVTWLNK